MLSIPLSCDDGLRGSGLSAPTVEGAPPRVIVAGLCKRHAREDRGINPVLATGANPCRALLCRSRCRLRESPLLSQGCSRRHTALSLPRSVRRSRHRHRHPAGLRNLNLRDARPLRFAPQRTTTSPSIRRPRLVSAASRHRRRSVDAVVRPAYPRLVRSAARDNSDCSDPSRAVTRHRRRRVPVRRATVLPWSCRSGPHCGTDIGIVPRRLAFRQPRGRARA
jgi:hypothetical protein